MRLTAFDWGILSNKFVWVIKDNLLFSIANFTWWSPRSWMTWKRTVLVWFVITLSSRGKKKLKYSKLTMNFEILSQMVILLISQRQQSINLWVIFDVLLTYKIQLVCFKDFILQSFISTLQSSFLANLLEKLFYKAGKPFIKVLNHQFTYSGLDRELGIYCVFGVFILLYYWTSFRLCGYGDASWNKMIYFHYTLKSTKNILQLSIFIEILDCSKVDGWFIEPKNWNSYSGTGLVNKVGKLWAQSVQVKIWIWFSDESH